MKLFAFTMAAIIGLVAFAQCGCRQDPEAASEPEPAFEARAALVCPSGSTLTTVLDLNDPQQGCAQATVRAENALKSFHLRTKCRQVDGGAELPVAVLAARATDCRVSEGRGVFIDLDVCCPLPTSSTAKPPRVVTKEAPSCPPWQTPARLNNLHYPEDENCADVTLRAQADLLSTHYRKACKAAEPRATRPATVVTAAVVECRFGGEPRGVSIDVELCCEGRVFEEAVFHDLIWRLSPGEVRQTLGEPAAVQEQVEGIHWTYSLEIVRDERVFPEVTLVFVDDRVNSYYF